MVRIKHRYLLVQILTPSNSSKITPVASVARDSKAASTPPPFLTHVHSPTPDTVTAQLILSHLRYLLSYLFGDHGAALAGTSLAIKYWSAATSTFIARCKRECVRNVWAALTWCTTLPIGGGGRGRSKGGGGRQKDLDREVVMRVVRVSGTIRKCEEEAIRRARVLCGRVMGLKVAMEGGITLNRTIAGPTGGEFEGDSHDTIVADSDVFDAPSADEDDNNLDQNID